MERRDVPVVGSMVLALGALALLAVVGQMRHGEVALCKGALAALARGRSSAQHRIAWEKLQVVGVDVGATYRHLPSDAERVKYRKVFIEQFARGFQTEGGSLSNFVRWRVDRRTEEGVIVAVDYPVKAQTLLFTVPAQGTKRVEAIQWR